MKQLAPLAAAFVLVLTAASARAEDAQSARQHYDKGSTFYDLGQFHDAAKEYEEAYKLKSDPALLFNIGQAYRFAAENAEALRAYKAYLRRSPEASNRREVEAHIVKLQKLIDEQRATAAPATTVPLVTTAPPSMTAPPPTDKSTNAATVVSSRAENPPLYQRWWLWTAVGGVALGVAVGLAVAYTTPRDAPAPSSAFTVAF